MNQGVLEKQTDMTGDGLAFEIHPFSTLDGLMSYMLINTALQQGVLIDPAMALLGDYLLFLDRQSIRLVASIDTHIHADRASASRYLRQLCQSDFMMNHRSISTAVSVQVRDTEQMDVAGLPFQFMYTPGHAFDHQVLRVGNHLFTGDCLLLDRCGRTDLPGADLGDQFQSLKKFASFSDTIHVYPSRQANGVYSMSMGEIRRKNTWLALSQEKFEETMAAHCSNQPKPSDVDYYLTFNSR